MENSHFENKNQHKFKHKRKQNEKRRNYDEIYKPNYFIARFIYTLFLKKKK